MKKIFCLFINMVIFVSVAYAGNIQYGYNAQGDYVPTSIGGSRINYGYNAQGDYVPVDIYDY